MRGCCGENITSKTEQDIMNSNKTFCLEKNIVLRDDKIIKAKIISLPEIRCVLVKFFQ